MLETAEADVELTRGSLELAGLPAVVTAAETALEIMATVGSGGVDVVLLNLELAGEESEGLLRALQDTSGSRKLPVIAFSDNPAPGADYVFKRPRDEGEYMGIVAAIKFYWMSAAPSVAPPPPTAPSGRPRRISGIDLMGLAIEPAEAYVLSMVDGAMGVNEISSVVGTDSKQTRAMLRRLAELGAVQWRIPHPSLPPPPPAPGPPSLPPPPSDPPEAPLGGPAPAEPVDETGRFTAERRKMVDDAYALLDEANHYELLGVPSTATRNEIRSAYFPLAKLFHTDTLFRVELGDYARKMNRIFQALTEAYEVLGKKKNRAAYDSYLGVRRETLSLDMPVPGAIADLPDEVDEPPKPQPPSPRPPEQPVEKEPEPPRPTPKVTVPKPGAAAPETRRDAQPPTPKKSAEVSRQSLNKLARTLKVVSQSARRPDRAARLIADAKKAEKAGNVTGAAEAYRIASAWRPNDKALKHEAMRLREMALSAKSEAYERRAGYAEKNQKWDEAALCWSRVADARPEEPRLAMLAANAIVRAKGDLARAGRYAKLAVNLDGGDGTCHRVLGEVYVAAGKPASGKRSLNKALELNEDDEKARELLRALG